MYEKPGPTTNMEGLACGLDLWQLNAVPVAMGSLHPFLVGLAHSCFPNLTPGVQFEVDRIPPRRVPADMASFLPIPTITILKPPFTVD